MDAGIVRADAAQMDQIANQLHALVGSINGSVGRMSTGWFGPDAEQLIHRWQRQSRPAIEALAVQVHQLANRARNEAHEQDVASGRISTGGQASPHTAGSEDAGLALLGIVSGAFGTASAALSWFTKPFGVPDTLRTWGRAARFTRFADQAKGAARSVYNSGQQIARLGRGAIGKDATRLVKYLDLPRVAKGLGPVGNVLGGVSHVLSGVEHIRQGDVAGGVDDGVGLVADGLKSSKNPVAYLGGVAIATWADVGKMARDTDWSYHPPPPSKENFMDIYVGGAALGLKQMPGKLWNDLF